MAPLIAQLIASGMGMLGNALLAKGKEAVEEKIGIRLPNLGSTVSSEELAVLKQAEMQHEEALLAMATERLRIEVDLEKSASAAVTARWQADMSSDSRLAKNIRPGALAYLLFVVSVFAGLEGATSFNVPEAYIQLFGTLLNVAFTAYFVGRTTEKGIDTYQRWKSQRGG